MSATDAQTNASATPILDRQHPLPPATPLGSGTVTVLFVWLGLFAALVVCAALGQPPVLRQWLFTDIPHWVRGEVEHNGLFLSLLSVLGAIVAMLVIHEGGHILAGMCVGFRYHSLRVGPLVFGRSLRVSLYTGPGASFNAVAGVLPVTTDKLVLRSAVMVLGGPSANILSGCAVLLLPPLPHNFFFVIFAVISIANGLSDLIPSYSRLGVSDGGRLWMLVRNPGRAERWLALMKLGAEYDAGVLPEALPPDFLAKAVAVRDESPDTPAAHAWAYSAAFHRREDAVAGEMLEACLRHSNNAPPTMRAALMSDAAVFQARRRKRVDLAERWMAEIPQQSQLPWLRTRAEAAILEAHSDFAGARKKLDEFEAAILAMARGRTRETMLILLGRWKGELGGR
jgi:hypothetical protein